MPQIVVIDDDERLTEMLRRLLAHAGWSVATANSGAAGLPLLAQPGVELVGTLWDRITYPGKTFRPAPGFLSGADLLLVPDAIAQALS
jgi:CheY-like chemotaxis protein